MARLRRGRLRWAIAGGLVIALVVAAVVAWPYVQRYTGSAPPPQFYDKVQLEPALARDYPRVRGVAHNAGNNLGTLSMALHYGADVIEIDVISARGQLVAGRNHWWGWLARQVFRGPTLAQAWDGAAPAGIIKLDLMQTDRGFLDDLVAFLAPRAGSRRVMISTHDLSALLYLHSRLPDVAMLFSVAASARRRRAAAWSPPARTRWARASVTAPCHAVPCQVAADLSAWASQERASSRRPPSVHAIEAGTAIMTWQKMHENGSSSLSTASSRTANAASVSGATEMSVPYMR